MFENTIVLSRYCGKDAKRVGRSVVEAAQVAALFAGPSRTEQGRWQAADAHLLAWRPTEGGAEILLHVPMRKPAPVRLESGSVRQTITAKLPAMVAEMSYRLSPSGKRHWTKIGRVFACFTASPKASTPLCAYPLPNCYADGKWCHGEVSVDKAACEGREPGELLRAAFVTDAVHTAHTSHQPLSPEGVKKYGTVTKLLRASQRKPVPERACRRVTTLGALLAGRGGQA